MQITKKRKKENKRKIKEKMTILEGLNKMIE